MKQNIIKIIFAFIILFAIYKTGVNIKYIGMDAKQIRLMQIEDIQKKNQKTAQKFVTSYKIVENMQENVAKELNKYTERQRLMVEDAPDKIALLTFKNRALLYLNGWEPYVYEMGAPYLSLTAPSADYCYSCKIGNSKEEREKCLEEYSIKSSDLLIENYNALRYAYKTKKITLKEFNHKKLEIKKANEKIIKEARLIYDLVELPQIKFDRQECQVKDEFKQRELQFEIDWREELERAKATNEGILQSKKEAIEKLPKTSDWDNARHIYTESLKKQEELYKKNVYAINERYEKIKKENHYNVEMPDINKNDEQAKKQSIYKKIRVSKECFDAWKIIDTEGQYTNDKLPCIQADIDKIDEYCGKTDVNCYEN